MGHKRSKPVIFIETLTGIALIVYVYYHVRICGMAGVRLEMIPFMARCVIIVIAGFVIATLCECVTNKARIELIPKVILGQVIKVLVIVAVIVIVCLIVIAAM